MMVCGAFGYVWVEDRVLGRISWYYCFIGEEGILRLSVVG